MGFFPYKGDTKDNFPHGKIEPMCGQIEHQRAQKNQKSGILKIYKFLQFF